jgi:acetyl esterase/lipase
VKPNLLLLSLLSLTLGTLSAARAEPEVIPLWPEGVPGAARADSPPEVEKDGGISHVHVPTLTHYAPEPGKANGTAIIVCPGGGYVHLSMRREGIAIAAWLRDLGVNVFVLKYRLADYGQPAPLQDVVRALRLVRSRASDLGVAPDRIGVMGFSAGGHLSASAGTLWDLPAARTGAALDAVSGRPDFIMPIYPVITMRDPFVHAGSRRALLGQGPAPESLAQWSLEEHVTAATPPTFLVHTQDDKSVPVENSLAFYGALRRAGVPAELHVYEKSPHGMALERGVGTAAEWPHHAEAWLRARGLLPAKNKP